MASLNLLRVGILLPVVPLRRFRQRPQREPTSYEDISERAGVQRVQVRVALDEWEHDPASVRSWWCDLGRWSSRPDLLSHHWTRRYQLHQRHLVAIRPSPFARPQAISGSGGARERRLKRTIDFAFFRDDVAAYRREEWPGMVRAGHKLHQRLFPERVAQHIHP